MSKLIDRYRTRRAERAQRDSKQILREGPASETIAQFVMFGSR